MTNANVAELLPLPLLRPGQCALVDQVVGMGSVVHRLCEMGLRRGAEVQMIRAGRPCLVRLNGQTLGLRSEELGGVLVRAGAALA